MNGFDPPRFRPENIASEEEAVQELNRMIGGDSRENEVKTEKKRPAKLMVLRVVAFFVSLCSTFMSVYYTALHFSGYLHIALAILMSIAIVACVVLLPEYAIQFYNDRRWLFLTVALLSWIPSVMFSMSTTVGGIYNERSIRLEGAKEIVSDAKAYKSRKEVLERRIKSLSSDLLAARRDAEMYSERASSLIGDKIVGREMDSLVLQRDRARKVVTAKEEDIRKAEDELSSLEATKTSSVVVRKDFYSWIADRFSVESDTVEFMSAVFPAIFIDVISPVMLSVALFL